MATVNSRTTISIDELVNDTIINGVIVDEHLLLITRGGDVIDAGIVTGADAASQTYLMVPVRACAEANQTLTGTKTIDSVALNIGDRVLLRGQTTKSENGVWIVQTGAWTRSPDADTAAKVPRGTQVRVLEGGENRYKDLIQMEPSPGGANGQVWDLVTAIDVGGMFTYPVAQSKGQLFFDANQHEIAVWNGLQWEFTGQPLVVTSLTRPGPFNAEGMVIYESDTSMSFIWQNAQWKRFGSTNTPGSGGFGTVPLGSVITYAGDATPAGFLLCDGAVYNKTDWPELFEILKAKYGGDGTTTFAVPDLRGRSAIGAGQGTGLTNRVLAAKGGSELAALTSPNQLPSHSHGVNTGGHNVDHTHGATSTESTNHQHTTPVGHNEYSAANWTFSDPADHYAQRAFEVWGSGMGSSNQTVLHTHNTGGTSTNHVHSIAAEGLSVGHENMSPFTTLNYIIRAAAVPSGGGGGTGGGQEMSFTFTNSTNWVCVHGLNDLQVDVYTTTADGNEIIGDVWRKDANTVEIHWAIPVSGTAYIEG